MSVNSVPLGMSEGPDGFNAVTVYALDKNGVWLPALTQILDIDQINAENLEQPLRLAVSADAVKYPE